MSAPTPSDQEVIAAAVRKLQALAEKLEAEINLLRARLIEKGKIKPKERVTFEDIRKSARRWR